MFGRITTFFIDQALTRDIMDIARHKYGCSMLQRCLDYATEKQVRRAQRQKRLPPRGRETLAAGTAVFPSPRPFDAPPLPRRPGWWRTGWPGTPCR